MQTKIIDYKIPDRCEFCNLKPTRLLHIRFIPIFNNPYEIDCWVCEIHKDKKIIDEMSSNNAFIYIVRQR